MKQEVLDALRLLYENDAFLLEADVHERTIASALQGYLAQYFPHHHVDVEYNRHGLDAKAVNLPEGCRGGGEKLIFPDVIVHQRGHDNENLLVVQLKKTTNNQSRFCDRAIIEAMKREFHYRQGLWLELPAGRDAVRRPPRLEWM
jgi:hypothetical protein